MHREYDYLVFIGRFQPFHNGHLAVVREALAQADTLIMLCGSARQAPSTRNPWATDEIEGMVRACLDPAEQDRVQVIPLPDALYNEKRWLRSVQAAVNGVVAAQSPAVEATPNIGLIGMDERGDGYYPSRFPRWGSVAIEDEGGFRATVVREALFGLTPGSEVDAASYLDSEQARAILPDPVRHQLIDYIASPRYAALYEEAAFINRYAASWRSAPHPPTFMTVDAIVVQAGHVLLIERRAYPGKGLYALPGGFVNQDETLKEACLRELREETRLKVPAPVLKGSIKAERTFDAPFRSQRGRTIAQGFLIELAATGSLPKVKGGDDARRAFWVPLADLQPEQLFEDHYHIIQAMIG